MKADKRRGRTVFRLISLLFSSIFTPKNHATQIVRVRTCLQHGPCGDVSLHALPVLLLSSASCCFFLLCKRVSLPLRWLPKQNKQIKPLLPLLLLLLTFIGIGMQNLFLSTHALASTHAHTHTHTLSRPLSAHTKLTLSLSRSRALLQNKAHVSVCLLAASRFFLPPSCALIFCCPCCCAAAALLLCCCCAAAVVIAGVFILFDRADVFFGFAFAFAWLCALFLQDAHVVLLYYCCR